MSQSAEEITDPLQLLNGLLEETPVEPAPNHVKVSDQTRKVGYEEQKKTAEKIWAPLVQDNQKKRHLDYGNAKKVTVSTGAMLASFTPETDFEQSLSNIVQKHQQKQEPLPKVKDVKMSELHSRDEEIQQLRELMFYAQQKAKRIKKIKSKAYRKRRRRALSALTQVREVDEEDAEEKAHYDRALARASLKHQNTSKWTQRQLRRMKAKTIDEEARQMVTHQSELYKRLVQRKELTPEEEFAKDKDTTQEQEDSDSSSDESYDEGDGSEAENQQFVFSSGRALQEQEEEQEEVAKEEESKETTDVNSSVVKKAFVVEVPKNNADTEAEEDIDWMIDEDFAAEKEEVIQESFPVWTKKTDSSVLPGWGNWAGVGITAVYTDEQRKIMEQEKTDRATVKQHLRSIRKDKDKPNVILNQQFSDAKSKYLLTQIPYPYKNKHQFQRELQKRIGKEWKQENDFADIIRPKTRTRQGNVIVPLQRPTKGVLKDLLGKRKKLAQKLREKRKRVKAVKSAA